MLKRGNNMAASQKKLGTVENKLSPSERKSTSSQNSQASSNKMSLFAFPTLKELAAIELISQLGSVEEVEQYIKNNPAQGLYEDTQRILTKIKTLHQYVEENKVEEVHKLLEETPAELLPVLLTTKSVVVTSAKGLDNKIVVQGTALMMALGFEAVGRDGCDLCLMQPHSQQENTTLKKLSLYSDDQPLSPFKYLVDSKEYTIERGNNEGQLSAAHFDRLKEIFVKGELYNQNLNLDHPALNETQRDAYAALLKMTEQRKHTLFVNEEGMVEMLHRHIKRAMPDKGEEEIAKQTFKQLPEGWEKEEEDRYQEDLATLKKFRQAIKESKTNDDPELKAARQKYRERLEPESKKILQTGIYGRARLLSTALEIGDKEYFYDWRKDDLYYDQGVSWPQRLEPTNCKQDMAQGLYYTRDLGKKSNRSLKYTHGGGDFVLPDSDTGVGFDSWVDVYFGGWVGGSMGRGALGAGDSPAFSKLCTSKDRSISAYYAAARQLLKRNTVHNSIDC
jgi:hypothetical protein